MPTPESPTAPSLAAGTLDITGGFHRCQPVGRGLFNKGSRHGWLLMPYPMLPPVVLLKALSQPLPSNWSSLLTPPKWNFPGRTSSQPEELRAWHPLSPFTFTSLFFHPLKVLFFFHVRSFLQRPG